MSIDQLLTPLNVALAIAAGGACAAAALIRHHGGFRLAVWGGERREVGRMLLASPASRHRSEITVFVVTPRKGRAKVMIKTSNAGPGSRGFSFEMRSSKGAMEIGRLFVEAGRLAGR